VVAAILQKAGLICYSRGKIMIRDRIGLESASCECYRIVKDEFDRLLKTLESPKKAEGRRQEAGGRRNGS